MKVFLSTSGYRFDGYKIKEYLGYCSADYVIDMDLTFETLEHKLAGAKSKVLGTIEQNARESGANALIGLNVSYTVFTPDLVVVEARGTAVVIQADPHLMSTAPDDGQAGGVLTAAVSESESDPNDTVWFYDSEEQLGVSGREAAAEEPEFGYSIKEISEEDEPGSVYRELLIAVEEMGSAQEIGAYMKGFSEDHGCSIDMQLIKDIRDSVLIEQKFGNQKSYIVNKIKEYIFEEE